MEEKNIPKGVLQKYLFSKLNKSKIKDTKTRTLIEIQDKSCNILSPEKIIYRLPIILTQFKVENNTRCLKNKVSQLHIYLTMVRK